MADYSRGECNLVEVDTSIGALDAYLVEQIAQNLLPSRRDLARSETYEHMRDTVMFARTCRRIHDIVEPLIERAARESSRRTILDARTQNCRIAYVDQDGKLHNYYDPAVVSRDCTEWYIDGMLHRLNGPAVMYLTGFNAWYIRGLNCKPIAKKAMRSDARAADYVALENTRMLALMREGLQFSVGVLVYQTRIYAPRYIIDGIPRGCTMIHSIGDEPASILGDGTRKWYSYGQLHRENGPAIEYPNGDRDWYCDGKLHREDGPAIERANGSHQYWRDGEYVG